MKEYVWHWIAVDGITSIYFVSFLFFRSSRWCDVLYFLTILFVGNSQRLVSSVFVRFIELFDDKYNKNKSKTGFAEPLTQSMCEVRLKRSIRLSILIHVHDSREAE